MAQIPDFLAMHKNQGKTQIIVVESGFFSSRIFKSLKKFSKLIRKMEKIWKFFTFLSIQSKAFRSDERFHNPEIHSKLKRIVKNWKIRGKKTIFDFFFEFTQFCYLFSICNAIWRFHPFFIGFSFPSWILVVLIWPFAGLSSSSWI